MTLQIGFILFPNVQQLDVTGPYEVLAGLPGAKLHLAALSSAPVTSVTGLMLTPTVSFEASPQFDILCVPGGAGVNALMRSGPALDFIRRQAEGARHVTSVCTGALVLGEAGLLEGRRATTHWNSLDLLASYGATPVKARAVTDGNLVTGGGVTAGMDFGLTLAAEIAGRAFAEGIQLGLEYAPAPPFDAGSPETARPAVVSAVRARMAETRAEREALAAAYAARRKR